MKDTLFDRLKGEEENIGELLLPFIAWLDRQGAHSATVRIVGGKVSVNIDARKESEPTKKP